MATYNLTGVHGKGLARDTVNEHKVKKVKRSVRGLHGQLTDLLMASTVYGADILQQLEEHDEESMLLALTGGRTSYQLYWR